MYPRSTLWEPLVYSIAF